MSYTLTLTDEDIKTIAFVGGRYEWSKALLRLDVGENILSELEAWLIREAFDSDTEGGHGYFPMLDGRSELASKLTAFADSIV